MDAGYVVFDALWILALALNNTMTMVKNQDITKTNCDNIPGSLVNFQNFTYKNRKMGCVIRWNLNNTNFSGVSVCLSKYCYSIGVGTGGGTGGTCPPNHQGRGAVPPQPGQYLFMQ